MSLSLTKKRVMKKLEGICRMVRLGGRGVWRYERVTSATGGRRQLAQIEFRRQQQRAERRYRIGSGKENAGAASMPEAYGDGKRRRTRRKGTSSAQEDGSFCNGRIKRK